MIKTKTMRDCAFYCLNLKVCLYVCMSVTETFILELKLKLTCVVKNLVVDIKIPPAVQF